MRLIILILVAVSLSVSAIFAQRIQEANTAFRKQNYDRAVEIYDALIEKNPEDARLRAQRAHALIERVTEQQSSGRHGEFNYTAMQRDAEQALDDLTAAIKAGVGAKGVSQTWRGRAYLLLYRHDDALADLNNAIEQKPERATAYYYRGLLHRQRGDTTKAFEDFHTALRYKPEDALAYRERAMCQLDQGLDKQCVQFTKGNLTWIEEKINGIKDPEKIQMAVADFERALAVDPSDCESRRAMANLFSLTGDAKRCLEQLDEVCKRQPDNVCSWCTRAWIQSTHSNPEYRNGAEAVKAAQKALEVSKGRDSCLLMNLATAYAEAGEFKKAVATAKEALQALTADKQFPTPQDHPCGEKYVERIKQFNKKQPYRDPSLKDFSKK